MKSKRLVILPIFLAMPFFIGIGCGEAPTSPEALAPTPTPTPKPEPKVELTLQPLAEWKGIGTKTTEPFLITKTPWVVSWAFQPKLGAYGIEPNYFGVTVRQPNDRFAQLVANIANMQQGTTDNSYIYETGTFYLEIDGIGGDWAVKVTAYAPTPTPTPTPTPAPTPKPETSDLEPLPTEQIALTLPGTPSGTYEIEFRHDLEAGRKITGSIEWEGEFTANWRLKIRGPEGVPIKVWDIEGLTFDFEYTATVAGEYAIRIINQKDPSTHHGTMEITGSWTQTEY